MIKLVNSYQQVNTYHFLSVHTYQVHTYLIINITYVLFMFQDTYGNLLDTNLLPTEEAFEMFDVNQDGILFYEEWQFSFGSD